ncbi:MAG: domain containing protein, partial [Bacteroidota bacterium]|nr:domain containing protein [Bacteroidota bacterium]
TVYYYDNGNRRNIVAQGGDESLFFPFTSDGNTRMAFGLFNANKAFASEKEVYRTVNLQSDTPVWTQLTNINRTIMAMATSPADSNVLYFISNNGRFYKSLNALSGTPTFTNTALPFTPQNVATIAPVKTSANTVYISIDNRVYRTTNAGTTWTNITLNLPNLNHVRIIHDENSSDESVYLATGSSVYYKNVGLSTWQNVSQNLPSIANIQDFNIYNDGTACSKLRVAYYGRGVWEAPLYPNSKPVVTATADVNNICPNNNVHFSFGYCGSLDSIRWTFAGGSPGSTNAANPTVFYSTAGVYPATIIAYNAFGSDTALVNITVTGTFAPPVVEGFELPVYPPVDWKLIDAGSDGMEWLRSTRASGYGNSTASILFDNYNWNTNGAHDQLWTKRLNFDTLISAQLTFDVAYAPWGGGCGYPDSLNVEISTDCGITQNVVYSKSCATLATTGNIQDSLFVPLPTEWRTDTVNLNAYAGTGDVLIIFDNVGHYGQGIYVDNINITGVKLQPPVIAFTANKQTICAGDSVTFTDQSSNNPTTWNWSFSHGNPATASIAQPTVVYDSAGTYPVTLTAGNIYGSNTQTFNSYITVNPLPQQPVVTRNGNILFANSFSSGNYQWYLNGVAINGATATSYNPTLQGVYSVVLTDPNGCSSGSATFNFTFTSIIRANENSFSISPNPSSGKFLISINLDGIYKLNIQNALGQQVLEYTIGQISAGVMNKQIDLSGYEAGIYIVTVSNADKKYVSKVALQ